jgi:hypothetical protein
MIDPAKQTLTIANTQTTSPAVSLSAIGTIRLLALSITAPAVMAETVNIEISTDDAVTFARLQSGGADIALVAAKAIQLTELVATHLRLVAGAAVAADRVFKIIGTARN